MASEHHLQVQQERTFCSGMLSVTTTFKLLVTGDTDLKHLDRLIRILRMQQQILAEDECSPVTDSKATSPTTTEGATVEPTATMGVTGVVSSTDACASGGEVASAATGIQSKEPSETQ